MIDEPTLEQIWEIRRKIYAQCDNDPQKLVAHFIERQNQNPQRLLQKFGDTQKRRPNSAQENLPVEAAKTAEA